MATSNASQGIREFYIAKSADEKTIRWYSQSRFVSSLEDTIIQDSSNIEYQFNTNGVEYYYIALLGK